MFDKKTGGKNAQMKASGTGQASYSFLFDHLVGAGEQSPSLVMAPD
jgi:hypothetical protein